MQQALYREILLRGKHGCVVLVDDADFADLAQYRWYRVGAWTGASGRQYGPYAGRFERDADGKKRTIMMHRYLLGLGSKNGQYVDHLNGDGLDNRRANIEVTTHAENMRRIHTNTTSIPSMRHRIRTLEVRLAEAKRVLAELESAASRA